MKIFWNDIVIKKEKLIEKGSIVLDKCGLHVLTAPNGMGKSLLLENITKSNDVILVAQEESVLTNLTLEENIIFQNGDLQKYEALVSRYNLHYLKRKKIKTMSGGEKRLVNLLRGLCSKKSILLLDEPTNDLDYKNVKILCEILKQESLNRWIFVVSHDDRILELADGTYTIHEKQIVLTEQKKEDKLVFSYSFHPLTPLTGKGAKKIIKKSFLGYVFTTFMCILTLLFSSLLIDDSVVQYEPMEENNMYLFVSGYTFMGEMFATTGAAPLNENLSIEEVVRQEKELPAIKLENNANYNAYMLEYYLPEELRYINVIDSYKEKYAIAEDTHISATFQYPCDEDMDVDSIYRFDLNEYKNVIRSIEKDDSAMPTFIVIELKGNYTFQEFIASQEIAPLKEKNVWVMNNDTINQMNASLKVSYYSKNAGTLMLLLLGVFFIETIIQLSYLYTIKRRMVALYHYGYNRKQVYDLVKRQNRDFAYRILLVIAACILIARSSFADENPFMCCIICILLTFFCIGSFFMKKLCNYCYSKKIYKQNR